MWKKGKEEVWKEKWDQEQKRKKKNEVKQKEDSQKRRWRKKDQETWDTEKKGETRRWRSKERMEKREKRKRREHQKEMNKMMKEKVMKEKGKCWKKKWNKRRDGTKTKNEGVLSEFFLWFFMKREKDFKRKFKLMEKSNGFFAHEMFLNQENRNRKQKRVFPTFHDKKTHSCFWKHQKGEKRETELKRRIKKRRVIKTRNHFFKTQKKTKHGKTCKKSPREKGKRENDVFCGEKKKNSFAKV